MISHILLQAATTTKTIGGPSTAYLPVMVFFVFAIVFPVLPLVLGRFLRPFKYEKNKMRPYECGIDPETARTTLKCGLHHRDAVSDLTETMFCCRGQISWARCSFTSSH